MNMVGKIKEVSTMKHSQAKYRILIADDEEQARSAVRAQIESIGHEVIGEATNGEEALALAQKLLPDCVVMDIRMPKMDGITAAKTISDAVHCPVLLLTAFTNDELSLQAAESGAYYYLTKPAKISDLRSAIQVCIARFKELQQVRKRLESKTLIQRAKGILMDEFGLKEQEAHAKIHFTARNRNLTMEEVAKAIIEKKKMPE